MKRHLAAVLLLAQSLLIPVFASNPDQTFSEVYKASAVSSNAQVLEVSKKADVDYRSKHFSAASAESLAAAAYSYGLDNFERARPAFDRAFLAAKELGPDDKKQFLQALSLVVSSNRSDRDLNTYKYFSQQKLVLMKSIPGSDPNQRYFEAQTIALSCSRNKHFQEAEALLTETLKELESVKPLPTTYGTCLATLARVYSEAGDQTEAQRFYAKALAIVREKPDANDYENVLRDYLYLLLDNKKFAEAAAVGDEYYTLMTSPAKAGWRNRVSFALYARMFAESNLGESDKFYRAEFDNQKGGTKTAMNMGYAQTCIEWAAMLHKFGKTSDAIRVLQDGMDFCRSAKWPDAFDRNMPKMVVACENYMRELHKDKEADLLQATYEKEKLARQESAHAKQADRLTHAAISEADSEEIEASRHKEYIQNLPFREEKQVVDRAIAADQFDKAEAKWKEVVTLAEQSKSAKQRRSFPNLSMFLKYVGDSFAYKKQLSKARDVLLVAYKYSIDSTQDCDVQEIAESIESVADKYRISGDAAAGEALLQDALDLSKATLVSDSWPERMWMIKEANFCAAGGDKVKTKKCVAFFLSSINKPGLTVSKITSDQMANLENVLQKNGFSEESEKVAKKLYQLGANHCVMNDMSTRKK